MGNTCWEQLCVFAAALQTVFEERQLWGVALVSNFGKPLSATTLGGALAALGHSCSEQLSITTLGPGFGEQLCGAALGSSFGKQEQLGGSFARQLRTEALKNRSFGKQLYGLALERNVGGQLLVATLRSSFRRAANLENSFGATALQRCFVEQLWEAAAGNRFGEQL